MMGTSSPMSLLSGKKPGRRETGDQVLGLTSVLTTLHMSHRGLLGPGEVQSALGGVSRPFNEGGDMEKLTEREAEILTKFAYRLRGKTQFSPAVMGMIASTLKEFGVDVHPAHERALDYASQIDTGGSWSEELLLDTIVETFEAGYDAREQEGLKLGQNCGGHGTLIGKFPGCRACKEQP